MDIAALVAWIVTAGGGIYLVATWLAAGGVSGRGEAATRLPVPVVFAHALVAVVGLILWIIYLVTDTRALAWVSFVLLLVIAVAGLVMVMRWLPAFQARRAIASGSGVQVGAPPEARFPVAVVGLHGVLAVATVVLVLLSALQIGS